MMLFFTRFLLFTLASFGQAAPAASATPASTCTNGDVFISGRICTKQCNTSYTIGDYKVLSSASLDSCMAACAADTKCSTATFYQPTNICTLRIALGLTFKISDTWSDSFICGAPLSPSCSSQCAALRPSTSTLTVTSTSTTSSTSTVYVSTTTGTSTAAGDTITQIVSQMATVDAGFVSTTTVATTTSTVTAAQNTVTAVCIASSSAMSSAMKLKVRATSSSCSCPTLAVVTSTSTSIIVQPIATTTSTINLQAIVTAAPVTVQATTIMTITTTSTTSVTATSTTTVAQPDATSYRSGPIDRREYSQGNSLSSVTAQQAYSANAQKSGQGLNPSSYKFRDRIFSASFDDVTTYRAALVQGFFISPQTGTYFLTSSAKVVDNIGYAWVGNVAYSAWQEGNQMYKVLGPNEGQSSGNYTFTANKGDIIPFTFLTVNGAGPGVSDYSITPPGSASMALSVANGNIIPACDLASQFPNGAA